MENYYKRDNGRLEFSSEQKNNSNLNMDLILDLSRKKSVTPTLPEINMNQTIGSSQMFAHIPSIKKRYPNFLDQVTQTPIPGSSAMLSPYSESNSPKRMKNESVNHYENSSQLKHTATLTNIHDITPGITMITPQQPSLHVIPNEVTNIPVAIPTISIPYMETSQSFITANEARRKISMPAECSTSTDMKPTSSLDTTKKVSRPFKAYPNGILSIASTINHDSTEYAKFRQSVLEKVKKNSNTPNPKMRRVSKSPGLPTSTVDEKDAAYWERRRKNNEAAKRSRDARRAKEDELAIRASFLEQENKRLRRDIQEFQKALAYYEYKLQHQDNLV